MTCEDFSFSLSSAVETRSPNIFRVIKSRRLSWEGHAARMEEGRSAFKILTGKTYRKENFGEA